MTAPTSPTSTEEVERYGWQLLAADATSLTAGLASQSGGVLLGGYLLGGPAIHLLHGSGGRALGSLGLRVALPLGGAMAGAAMAECSYPKSDHSFCGLGEFVVGGLVGVVAASVIDYTLLARTVTHERQPAMLRYRRVSATPNLGVNKRGDVTLGLTGSF